ADEPRHEPRAHAIGKHDERGGDEETAAAAEKTETERRREQTHATFYCGLRIADCGGRIAGDELRMADCGLAIRNQSATRNPRSAMSACYIPSACANAVVVVSDLDADRMPAAVLRAGGLVAEVILLAQLVGDARGGRIQIARIADDLGTTAAVVGHVAQRLDVDAIVVASAPAGAASATAGRSADGTARRPPADSAADRRIARSSAWKGHRNRNTRWPRRRRRVGLLALAVDPDRVHEDLAL